MSKVSHRGLRDTRVLPKRFACSVFDLNGIGRWGSNRRVDTQWGWVATFKWHLIFDGESSKDWVCT